MSLDLAACAGILRLKPIVEREMPAALDAFYGKVRATPRLSAFFRDDAHMAAAKAAQINHWDAIGSGRFDERYVAGVRAIGLAHARVASTGLVHRRLRRVVDRLVKAVVGELWPSGFLNRGWRKAAERRRRGDRRARQGRAARHGFRHFGLCRSGRGGARQGGGRG